MRSIFGFRDRLIDEYSEFSRSFTRIRAADIEKVVSDEYAKGRYWPEPLIQINPHYERKGTIPQLVTRGLLHPACAEIFQTDKPEGKPRPLELFTHQLEAIATARQELRRDYRHGLGEIARFLYPHRRQGPEGEGFRCETSHPRHRDLPDERPGK